jgi:uncharacterized protein YjbI with pentapeptide repeats
LKITPPQIPADLKRVDSFAAYTRALRPDDGTVAEIQCGGEQCEGVDFYKMDLRASVFANCAFHDCNFDKAGFVDVEFRSCDLSNSRFQGAYFERCRFVSCKCVGIDMTGAMMKQTMFEDTNLHYANFNAVSMNGVQFSRIDFSDSSIAQATLKRFASAESKFIRNDFTKTLLNGIDFSGNELIAPIVSIPPIELKGIVIDMLQAADLIGILGVKVKLPLAENEHTQ